MKRWARVYCVFQAAANADANYTAKNILPPFAEIPPLRGSFSELSTVAPGALWPPGAHQRSLTVFPSKFEEQVI